MSTTRVKAGKELPEVYTKLVEIGELVETVIDRDIHELVKLRASYLNGCAFCVDLHSNDALKAGESQQRLFLVGAWREAGSLFTEAERAVLALVDEATKLGEHGVTDQVYENVAKHFSEKEVAALIMAIGLINFYNRLGISTGMTPPKR